MSGVRTAAVSFMALILLCSPTTGPIQSDAHTREVQDAGTLCADSSIALIPLTSLPRPSSFVAFAPWRSRLKCLLEEMSHDVVDEFDLGPVFLPSQPSGARSAERFDHRLPTAPPLRC